MSLYRYYNRPNHSRYADSETSTSQNSNTRIENCEIVKKYSLIDCFCIKEIARSIAEKLGSEEDLLTDEGSQLIAESCFKNLIQVIENGQMFMRHSRRSLFTVKDFKMGLAGNNPSRVENLPTPFIP